MNSFLQGKKSLSTPPLRPLAAPAGTVGLSAASAAIHGKSGAACAQAHPTVEVVKEGDKVTRLIVVCSCGERIEIECLYPAGA